LLSDTIGSMQNAEGGFLLHEGDTFRQRTYDTRYNDYCSTSDMVKTQMSISRRSLVCSLAVAPLGGLMRAQENEPKKERVGYCIVGLGRISMGHFMPGCLGAKKARVVALVSGHRDKAEKEALKYKVPSGSLYSYDDFDKIAENKDIDAVYVALPNSMHAEYTIRAAKAGKHVLCEKPMAAAVGESEAMINACSVAKVKLMISYRCQYEPMNLEAVRIIKEGRLGAVQAIESANGFVERAGEWRLNKKMAGGGPLMDMGVYSLNACRYLTEEEPRYLEGFCSVIDHDGRFDEVEENVSFVMRFPSGIVASCNTSYGAQMDGYVRVHGSKGMLQLQPAFRYEGIKLTTHIAGEPDWEKISQENDPAQFTRQADYFADCIINNEEPKSNGDEGLRDMKYMAEIYKSCGRQSF
jgi:predicted dehydrogenase